MNEGLLVDPGSSRRDFCRRAALALGGLTLVRAPAFGALAATAGGGHATARSLAFHNLHTDEALSVVYFEDGEYVVEALRRIDVELRDHYDGSVHPIEPALLDVLHAVATRLETTEPFQVISGYRSPDTNEMLRKRGGLVSKNSLHMQGRAIDVRIDGLPTTDLRDAGIELGLGGVGYYARSDFVHLDTGRPRRWSY